MFNSSYVDRSNHNTDLKINAVNGTLVKNTADSRFITFELGSWLSDLVFDVKNPRVIINKSERYFKEYDEYHEDYYYQYLPITVLQVMLCGNNKVLVEIVKREV